MSEIIPRKKAVGVQARRAVPETIQIPGPDPIELPPAAAGVTQNIIYLNVTPGHSPPPSPSAPSEVHFHNTNVYHPPRQRRSLGTSFFGMLGLVIGAIAAGSAYVPQLLPLCRAMTLAGGVCSALGFLNAILFGRVGRGVPILALAANGIAYCMMLKNIGQLPRAISLPGISLPAAVAPITPADVNPAPAPRSVNPTPPDAARPHDHSIFGDGQGSWSTSSDVSPAPALTSVPPILPASVSSPMAIPIDHATATANLERARSAAALRMHVDYLSARAAAADADAAYQQARITYAPGTPELVAASKKHLDEDSKLKLIEGKLRVDPEVASAEAAVKSVKP